MEGVTEQHTPEVSAKRSYHFVFSVQTDLLNVLLKKKYIYLYIVIVDFSSLCTEKVLTT